MQRDDTLARKVEHLCDLEVEYDMTLRVLAVLVERIQHLSGSQEVQISDATLTDDLPDLVAWRDPLKRFISLQTTR